MKTNLHRVLFLPIFFFIGITLSQAQVFTIDIDKSTSIKAKPKQQSARTEGVIPLVLPFWDDFSWSNTIPSDSLWENSDNVTISAGNGINPPTYKVATFDGIKLNGTPYSTNFGDFESGNTDSLTSLPIDLSTLTTTEKNTVFLSFFYQKQGNGELPDNEDGLRLEFLSITATDTIWKTVIAPNIINGANVTDTAFHQIILQVTGEEYFHNHFQFRIISTGRKTGSFDVWNIDYVYLNKGRNSNDTTYLDRSFTKTPSSPFVGFTSIPIKHFLPIRDRFGTLIYSHFNSLGATQVFNFDLEADINYQLEDGSKFQYLNMLDTTNSMISNQANIEVVSDSVVNFSGINNTAIQATIKLKLFGDLQEDNIANKPYNSLVNDTICAEYFLKDYYAYDDGTAEKGAGVNSAGNEIAYQFPFLGDIESNLIGIDAYFPQAVGNTQHGEQIKIKVWSHATEGPDEVLYSRFLTIPRIDSLNNFIRVAFYSPIELTDTFYIGWEQLNSQRIFVGLDKNINSQDKIWLNTSGFWEPNNDQIVGSLMIRPYFKDTLITTSVNDIKIPTIKIYPNPSSRFFKFDTKNNVNFKIFNLSGQEVQPIYRNEDTTVILDFESFPSGVYIVKFVNNDSIYVERIFLTNSNSIK